MAGRWVTDRLLYVCIDSTYLGGSAFLFFFPKAFDSTVVWDWDGWMVGWGGIGEGLERCAFFLLGGSGIRWRVWMDGWMDEGGPLGIFPFFFFVNKVRWLGMGCVVCLVHIPP